MSFTDQQFLDTNEWKPIHQIPTFESCIEYFVNRSGVVMSTKGSKERMLTIHTTVDGYCTVSLQQRIGRKKTICVAVHKLVAFAFLPPPPLPYGNTKGCCNIDHKDDDKTNNHVDNLCWMTPAENMIKKEYTRGKGHKIAMNPTETQLRHRAVCRKNVAKTFSDPEKHEKLKKYKREWAAQKRAKQRSSENIQ